MADAVHQPGFYLIRRTEDGEIRCEHAKTPKEAGFNTFGQTFKGKQAEWQYIGDQSLSARSKEDQDLLVIAGDWNRMDNRGGKRGTGLDRLVAERAMMGGVTPSMLGTKEEFMGVPALEEKQEKPARSEDVERLYQAIDAHIERLNKRVEWYKRWKMDGSAQRMQAIIDEFQEELLETVT